jgi:hypothetical protein
MDIMDKKLTDLNEISNGIVYNLNSSSLFSTLDLSINAKFYVATDKFITEGNENIFMFAMSTKRIKPLLAVDFENMDFIPDEMSNLTTNTLASFPFPSVFDFISEINRPTDPYTMSKLKFNFKIQDLKYDLKKLTKKKNPQEIVDSINCKLTRLQQWRETLVAEQSVSTSNPFTNLYEWSEEAKQKYQSLKYLAKIDPKKALETQFDIPKTYIKIIDQWSDRLKRHFKYFYQSKRLFDSVRNSESTLTARWGKEFQAISNSCVEFAYLNFEHLTKFNVANPNSIEIDEKSEFLNAQYSTDEILDKLFEWMLQFNNVQTFLYENALNSVDTIPFLKRLNLFTFSESFLPESLMFDVWKGISVWRKKINSNDENKIVLNATDLNSDRSTISIGDSDNELDHTEIFKKTLISINEFTRKECLTSSKSVKENYMQLKEELDDMIEWWMNLVDEIDLVNQVQEQREKYNNKHGKDEIKWSKIISSVLKNGEIELSDSTDFNLNKKGLKGVDKSKEFSEEIDSGLKLENYLKLWTAHEKQLKKIEYMESVVTESIKIGRKSKKFKLQEIKKIEQINDNIYFSDFSKILNFEINENIEDKFNIFLFVMPRFFRNVAHDRELVIFFYYYYLIYFISLHIIVFIKLFCFI